MRISDWSSDVCSSDLAGQTGTKAMTIPRDATGGPREALGRQSERRKFQQLAQALMREVQAKAEIRRLAPNIRFTETREGLRIDIVDDADLDRKSTRLNSSH